MIGGFVLGAVTGAALVWFYGQEIREYIDYRTQKARARAAQTLGAAAGGLEAAREKLEAGLTGSHDTAAPRDRR